MIPVLLSSSAGTLCHLDSSTVPFSDEMRECGGPGRPRAHGGGEEIKRLRPSMGWSPHTSNAAEKTPS